MGKEGQSRSLKKMANERITTERYTVSQQWSLIRDSVGEEAVKYCSAVSGQYVWGTYRIMHEYMANYVWKNSLLCTVHTPQHLRMRTYSLHMQIIIINILNTRRKNLTVCWPKYASFVKKWIRLMVTSWKGWKTVSGRWMGLQWVWVQDVQVAGALGH